MTRKTYCGNLLWQSGLALLAPEKSFNIGCLVYIALIVVILIVAAYSK